MRTRTLRKWFQLGGLAVAGLGLTGCGLTQQHQPPMPPQARMQTPPVTGANVMNASSQTGNCWSNACAAGVNANTPTLAATATPPVPDFGPSGPGGPHGPAGAINAPVATHSNPATFGGPHAPSAPSAGNNREFQPVAGVGKSGAVVPADLKTTSGTLPLEGRPSSAMPGGSRGELPLTNPSNRVGNNRVDEVVMPPPPPPIPTSAANGPSPTTMSQATPLPSSAASGMVPPPPPPVPSTLPGLAPPPPSSVTTPSVPTLPMDR